LEKRIVYGINPVKEAMRSGAQFDRLLVQRGPASSRKPSSALDELIKQAHSHAIRVETADMDELKRVSGTQKHQGIVAVMRQGFKYSELEDIIEDFNQSSEKALILILDSIEDPQNMGTLIRSAEAANVNGVIIPKDRSAQITGSVTKASAGATEHVRIHVATNINSAIKRLKEAGVWVVALEADSVDPINKIDFDIDVALIVGSEGKGIRRLVKENSDLCAYIPLAGKTGSLNAAQAGTIALYEATRQRALKD
jgi:23S rRNA (guanosine2251-2'-O)-methyltransferase